jgi:hypothetical protein
MTSATFGYLTCSNSRCDHLGASHYGLTLSADEAALVPKR